MRSANSDEHAEHDPTPDRIRDAAIRCYGRQGMGIGLRAIAAEANVSVGLVSHHFGSKDGLQDSCDAYVQRVIREDETLAVSSAGPQNTLAQMANIEEYAPFVLYILRRVQAGGDAAQAFLEEMIADAREYLAAGMAAGTIRPSSDPDARARYLVLSSVGHLLLEVGQGHDLSTDAKAAELLGSMREKSLPILELFTEGLFTDTSILDAIKRQNTGDGGPDTPSPAEGK